MSTVSKVSKKNWLVGTGVATLLLLIAGVIGGGVLNQRKASERQKIASIGASWEKRKLMPQSDYIKLRQITSNVRDSGGVISDKDLDWSLATMKDAPDALVHARVLGMLSLLGENRPIPALQKAKVSAAIAPYLTSPNRLDKEYAVRVQRALAKQ